MPLRGTDHGLVLLRAEQAIKRAASDVLHAERVNRRG
jgi:hypothetical protein